MVSPRPKTLDFTAPVATLSTQGPYPYNCIHNQSAHPFPSPLPAKLSLKNTSLQILWEADLSNNKAAVSCLTGFKCMILFLLCNSPGLINQVCLGSGQNKPVGQLQNGFEGRFRKPQSTDALNSKFQASNQVETSNLGKLILAGAG